MTKAVSVSVRAWDAAQRAASLWALVVLAPVLAVIALSIRMTSRGPILYRAIRISRGAPFTMLKFRTMVHGAAGPALTSARDQRFTPIGQMLRRSRLDELPQLWHVVTGEMSLVGPRPEDPRYVDWSDPLHRVVFAARPGVTGPTALRFRNEENLLAEAANKAAAAAGRSTPTGDDLDEVYRARILPVKVSSDASYLANRSVWRDVAVLVETVRTMALGRGNVPLEEPHAELVADTHSDRAEGQ